MTAQDLFNYAQDAYKEICDVLEKINVLDEENDYKDNESLLYEFDILLQAILFKTAIIDGDFHNLEKQFIEQITDTGDIFFLINDEHDLNFDWEDIHDLSPETMLKLSGLIASTVKKYSDSLVQFLSKMDFLNEELDLFNYIQERMQLIFKALIAIDGTVLDEEIKICNEVANDLLFSEWESNKNVGKYIRSENEDFDYEVDEDMRKFYLQAPDVLNESTLLSCSHMNILDPSKSYHAGTNKTLDEIKQLLDNEIDEMDFPAQFSYALDYDSEQDLFVMDVIFPEMFDMPNMLQTLHKPDKEELIQRLVETQFHYAAGISLYFASTIFNLAMNVHNIAVRVSQFDKDDDENKTINPLIGIYGSRAEFIGIDKADDRDPVEIIAPFMFDIKNSDEEDSIEDDKDSIEYPEIEVHPDIKSLVYFENDETLTVRTPGINGMAGNGVFMGASSDYEPSMIDRKLRYEFVDNPYVEFSTYNPRYCDFDAYLRGCYIKFLSNPYDTNYPITFAYLLLYGLERRLTEDSVRWIDAFNVIVKLRSIRTDNVNFQDYCFRALCNSILLHKNDNSIELIKESFRETIDKNFAVKKDTLNAYLSVCLITGFELKSKEITRCAVALNVTPQTYSKKDPDLFERTMTKLLIKEWGKDYIDLNDELSINLSEFELEGRLFANTSLYTIETEKYDFLNNEKFINLACALYFATHDAVKYKVL